MKKTINTILISLLCFVGCNKKDNDAEYAQSFLNSNNIPVESIEWDSSKYENNDKYMIKKYTQEEKNEKNISKDAEIYLYTDDFPLPLTIQLSFGTYPVIVNSKLNYSYDINNEFIVIETLGNSIDITFNEVVVYSFELCVSCDLATYVIEINALERYLDWM